MIPADICQELVNEPTNQSSGGVDPSDELRDHLRSRHKPLLVKNYVFKDEIQRVSLTERASSLKSGFCLTCSQVSI